MNLMRNIIAGAAVAIGPMCASADSEPVPATQPATVQVYPTGTGRVIATEQSLPLPPHDPESLLRAPEAYAEYRFFHVEEGREPVLVHWLRAFSYSERPAGVAQGVRIMAFHADEEVFILIYKHMALTCVIAGTRGDLPVAPEVYGPPEVLATDSEVLGAVVAAEVRARGEAGYEVTLVGNGPEGAHGRFRMTLGDDGPDWARWRSGND